MARRTGANVWGYDAWGMDILAGPLYTTDIFFFSFLTLEPMTNAGGYILLDFFWEGQCDVGCTGGVDPLRDGVFGYVNSVASASVPEPGTIGLLGAGIAGLGFMRRRRSQAA